MSASTVDIPTGPGYKSLIFSIAVMVIIPTFGLWGCASLLAKYPTTFHQIWESKYDLCGRLWLFASFVSTMLVTVVIMLEIMSDERFNSIRRQNSFNNSVRVIIGISIMLPLLGLVGLFTPYWAYALWIMKFMALVIALSMWGLDYKIKNIVKAANDNATNPHTLHRSLEREFGAVVRLVDIPTTAAIALVILLSILYLSFLPAMVVPSDITLPQHSDSEIFVQGLSSGAVAVELWFANFLFWMMLRRHDD